MLRLVVFIVCFSLVQYRATGAGQNGAAQLMSAAYVDPGTFYAADFISSAAPLNPEREYSYVQVYSPFYHHQEYPPAHWDGTNVPSPFVAPLSRSPVLIGDYRHSSPGLVFPPGWEYYYNFPKKTLDHGIPLENIPSDPFPNRNSLFTPLTSTFTPVVDSFDPFDVHQNTNFPPSSTLRPPETITPLIKPVSTTAILSSATPNILRGPDDESSIPEISKSNPFSPLEPNTQPFETMYGSVSTPALLSSSSPNIIRGENHKVSTFRKTLQTFPYVSNLRPSTPNFPYQTGMSPYYSEISPDLPLSGFPDTLRGPVQDRVLFERAPESDVYAPYFDSYLQTSSGLKPHDRSLYKPSLMFSPNIIRKEIPASGLFPIFTTSPVSSHSSDKLTIPTTDNADTTSPIFTVTEKY